MSIYCYQGRDSQGKRCRGWTEADSVKNARTSLAKEGIFTAKIRALSLQNSQDAKRLALDSRSRAEVYNELGFLILAGFTIEKAVTMLLDENSSNKRCAFLLLLRDRIRNGSSLSQSLFSIIPNLPPFERATLESAERAGLQGEILTTLAQFVESEAEIRVRVKTAMAYPLAVLFLALGLLSLMVYVVLPRAAAIFTQFGSRLPESSRLLSQWGPRIMTLILLSLALGIGIFIRSRRKARTDRTYAVAAEKFVMRIPLVYRLHSLLWSMRFSGTMALLIKAGVTPQAAISVSGAATGSAWLTDIALEAADAVRNGTPLSTAIRQMPPVARHLAEWIRVGESTGNMQTMLEQASNRIRQTYDALLTKILGMLEPTLVALVGAATLAVALTVLRPMLELAKSAGT